MAKHVVARLFQLSRMRSPPCTVIAISSRSALQPVHQRLALQHHAPRAVDLEAHEALEGCVAEMAAQVLLADAEALHLVLRQVDAVLGFVVDAHVLPEVDDLQRRADVIGAFQVLGRILLEQDQQQPAMGLAERRL
jgi:hypothetical protein